VDVSWSFLVEQVQPEGVETLECDDTSCDPGSVLYAGSRSEPFLMGRVTDLPSAMEALAYPPEVSVEIDLTVTDELAPWNQGVYHWSIQKGKGRLSPLHAAASAILSLGIAAISQLIFGERLAREILTAGKGSGLREEEIALLEQIFPACHNFISEYF
jgi:predicted acetyltransferase